MASFRRWVCCKSKPPGRAVLRRRPPATDETGREKGWSIKWI
nr:MAG TPA: hypothetical protein [Caudoviricetes sp.]